MHDALTFQRTLFRRQHARIQRELGAPGEAFRRYQQRYRRRTAAPMRVLARDEVLREALDADILFVGDYHTLPHAQGLFRELFRRAGRGRRRIVLGLECVPSSQQPLLDAWQRGELDADGFFARLEEEVPDALALWPSFRALLTEAVALRLRIIGIDQASGGPRSLERRDAHAAERLTEALATEPRPQVLVLAGQFHVTPCHLPEAVLQRHRAPTDLRTKTLYQNCEQPWFTLQEAGQDPLTHGVAFADGALGVFSASPTLAQRTFIDYLEGGDEVLDSFAIDVHTQVPRMVLHLGKMIGLHVPRAAREALQVIPPGNGEALTRLNARADFNAKERAQLAKHLLDGHSVYVPRADTICLASLSRHHAAEEAAHRLRHLAVGARMDAPRPRSEAFYARIWEEALGFLGSRMLHPERPCQGLAEWSGALREEVGEARAIAAYVLSHKALELREAPELSTLPPPGEPGRFNAVTHALGYLLGDALSRSWRKGELPRNTLRALFSDPLEQPADLYLAWTRRLADPLPPAVDVSWASFGKVRASA